MYILEVKLFFIMGYLLFTLKCCRSSLDALRDNAKKR